MRFVEAGAASPTIGGAFTLVDQNGRTVTDEDFHGRWMLVYFGYTYCPDVCPTSLQDMTVALEELGPGLADKVVPVFVTVDPARDTVELMADYATLFHPRLMALTGDAEQVREAAKAYRVYYRKAPGSDDENYLVDHSAFIYLIDPEGLYVDHFGHDAGAEAMRARLAEVLG